MLFAIFAVCFFCLAFFKFIDLIFITPPTSFRDGLVRNLEGYLAMIIGHLLLAF